MDHQNRSKKQERRRNILITEASTIAMFSRTYEKIVKSMEIF